MGSDSIDNQAWIRQAVATAFADDFDEAFTPIRDPARNNREEIFCAGADCRFYAERMRTAGRRNPLNVPQPIESDPMMMAIQDATPIFHDGNTRRDPRLSPDGNTRRDPHLSTPIFSRTFSSMRLRITSSRKT